MQSISNQAKRKSQPELKFFSWRLAVARLRLLRPVKQDWPRAPGLRAAAFCRAPMVRGTPKPCIEPINAINEGNESNLILFS
jgi:hypothetical protein